MRLFFYGTLLQGTGNRVAVALHRHLAKGRPATTHGRLYALPDPGGWYPALLPDPAAPPVHGMVHESLASFAPGLLAEVDAYEGCTGSTGEYRRESIGIATAEGAILAEAYVYNVPLPPGAVALPHGSFPRFIAEGGLVAYC